MSQSSPTIRKRRNAAPASLTSVVRLDAFLATAPARRCTRVFVIRTSNESRVQFEAMFQAGVSLLPDDPDVQVLAGEGPSIVMPEGAQRRADLGAMELRRGSVPGGWGTKLLGWLIPIGRTLFVLYLDTARGQVL